MKPANIFSALALASNVVAMQNSLKGTRRLNRARLDAEYPPIPTVPTYNISIPIDHFSSDPQTYSNRYAVNDTYYKPGGPVILYDIGEGAMDPHYLGEILAEYNGTVSAPLRLAQELNGLVIAWEHRYYGYSQPVENDETTGVPLGGAADYEYLTIEQALEDVVYFANQFNTTALTQNEIIRSTENLDPYHTPWLALGASYPGIRAAWLRQRNPETFYASWASSAPLQTQTDGSIYWNPIYRALPDNCTQDIKAVFQYVDDILTSGSQDDIDLVRAGAFLVAPQPPGFDRDDLSEGLSWTDTVTVSALSYVLREGYYQAFGAAQTLQVFCDWMETFDVDSYLSDLSESSTDLSSRVSVPFENSGGSTPSAGGIVASQSSNGPAIGFAAFLFANRAYEEYLDYFLSDYPQFEYLTPRIDAASWSWQTLSQMGFFLYNNVSNPDAVFSKFLTLDSVLNGTKWLFSDFYPSDFPAQPNFTGPLSLGGWNAHTTNVMFTNGEFDPWRAFSVASEEQAAGAPMRTPTQTIPSCNRAPDGADDDVYFGLLYPGAVHAEDMSIVPYIRGAAISDSVNDLPLYQGLDLFVRAYNQWLPCFNQSRDDVRNGRGAAGSGSGSGSGSSGSASNDAASTSHSISSIASIAVTLATVIATALVTL